MGLDLSQSVQALKKKRLRSLKMKKFCLLTIFGLQTVMFTPAGISSLTASPAHFGLASPHNCMSQFLKIHCLSILYTYVFTSCCLGFSEEPWLIQYLMPFWQMMTTRIASTPDCLLSAFLETSHVTFTTTQCGQCYFLMIPMKKSKRVEITHSRSKN